ncbi:ABC transporter ATP-binding protein [Salinibacillus xinjiangensis]|uniref:ATP-binding cassette domain-containing protein n=1 Tax=Salinibacillus xinjiangensis TaxID=1229268 RepID=A0A6G1X8C3_9BACI|nr:ABC transporter ATP-binding protein [Salinibacillus xinjiangensis]MRG87192.1 ATP-binding cassette domain-containing protein [Salinibacillus xinjiangensis]
MTHQIKCKSISKVFYGDGVRTFAVDGVDLTFEEGEFVSIVGTSGSGKSTFLSLLGALDSPTSGEIIYGNESIHKRNRKQLSDFRFENIGFIFQQFHLLPTLTALENVMAPLFARKVSYDKRKRAEELLTQMGLEDKFHSLPSQLSGGQQQRVAIARAMVHEPSWLLADEPTGNLDTETGEIIFDLISTLNKEKSCGVIFVTHDPALAKRAERQIEMKDGKVTHDQRSIIYV